MALIRISDYTHTMEIRDEDFFVFGSEPLKRFIQPDDVDCKRCGAPTKYNEKCGYCG